MKWLVNCLIQSTGGEVDDKTPDQASLFLSVYLYVVIS
jgi:hypothetical protein